MCEARVCSHRGKGINLGLIHMVPAKLVALLITAKRDRFVIIGMRQAAGAVSQERPAGVLQVIKYLRDCDFFYPSVLLLFFFFPFFFTVPLMEVPFGPCVSVSLSCLVFSLPSQLFFSSLFSDLNPAPLTLPPVSFPSPPPSPTRSPSVSHGEQYISEPSRALLH